MQNVRLDRSPEAVISGMYIYFATDTLEPIEKNDSFGIAQPCHEKMVTGPKDILCYTTSCTSTRLIHSSPTMHSRQ